MLTISPLKTYRAGKKIFLDNAVIAMEPSKAVKEYKEDLAQAQEENEMLTKLVGKVTIEKEWLEKKLKSLVSLDKQSILGLKLKTLSLSHQCWRGVPAFVKAHFGHPSPQRGKSLTGLIQIYDGLIRPVFSKWLNAMSACLVFSLRKKTLRAPPPALSLSGTKNLHFA
ncbi:MAG: hypothetical protein HON51_06325 [Gammaproteobacteria bacterium]|nr:hypothetical protein [Gammaproteobacteria bacterium]MBT6418867.1 hypothetical protein [Gammaproteobacteria bacterium]MBT6575831.1 hypothetical protein [Gammaproteobacteria bacterium]MBT7435456.1 hypothetical protein [Gammaproteobacteria bacterium]